MFLLIWDSELDPVALGATFDVKLMVALLLLWSKQTTRNMNVTLYYLFELSTRLPRIEVNYFELRISLRLCLVYENAGLRK